MSTLHTISKSPDSRLLDKCLALCGEDDAILFIEDGVYHGAVAAELAKVPAGTPVYGLREDLRARGLLERRNGRLKSANMKRFVELCAEFDRVLGWF